MRKVRTWWPATAYNNMVLYVVKCFIRMTLTINAYRYETIDDYG